MKKIYKVRVRTGLAVEFEVVASSGEEALQRLVEYGWEVDRRVDPHPISQQILGTRDLEPDAEERKTP